MRCALSIRFFRMHMIARPPPVVASLVGAPPSRHPTPAVALIAE
jgi:hypothetical protein